MKGPADSGSGTIYISYCTVRDTVGTYRFDTGTGEWTKAGDWRLPFFSQGVHVPELGDDLLFGIELHDPYRFCAMDIASGLKMNGAPVLRHAWLDIVEPLPKWLSGINSVAYLGDGRFCIHRRFDIMAEFGMESVSAGTVVLLTGVEVVRAGSRLRMIKHKSKRLDCDIESVL
uniref:F-box associated domain-containing protein n=1 Tax=Aegilops tauschii TaxID=37682 RepID=N1QTZ6_AEGTA